MQQSTRQFGYEQEQQARNYLLQQGLESVTENYQCKMGELDLIMRDKDIYVFVEVRYRQRNDFGGGLASVDTYKQKKIINAAKYYLQQEKLYDKVPCRFDVVAIKDSRIEWIKDAFWVQY